MKKYLCVGCYNEYGTRAEAEACCGEEAEEMQEEEEIRVSKEDKEDFEDDEGSEEGKTELTE